MTKSAMTQSLVVPGLHDELLVPEQATTSRTVVSNDATRVVAFAMDAGQELTDHSAPRPVVVQVTEGDLVFEVGGARHDLTAGDLVYLAPSERHAVLALTPCRFVLVMVMAESVQT